MIEAQATAIGMLSVYNELFAVSILEPEHFVGPYQNLFKAMLDYYKKNGFITIEALLDYPGFDIDLLCKVLGHSLFRRYKKFQAYTACCD